MDSIQPEPLSVPHPGETVVEYLDFHAWSQRDLARRTGISPKTISEICNGKAPLSPHTSLALEKVFGRPAHFWLNLQARFDEAQARQRDLVKSSSWDSWVKQFPIREMKRRNWLPAERAESDVAKLLRFLGVSSPESWNSVWSAAQVAYRQTRKFRTSVEAVSAWIRATELAAEEIQVADFNGARLRSSIASLRSNTRLPIDEGLAKAQEICAAAGVAFVVVPELPHTGISGCARWVSDRRAIVAVTLRYKTDDQIWFTFFHELGHILLHRNRKAFILDNADDNLGDGIVDPEMRAIEEEANRFSADTLIPPRALAGFIARVGSVTNDTIHDFAETVDIAPGIVVGRLQHERVLAPHQGNRLKQFVDWGVTEEK